MRTTDAHMLVEVRTTVRIDDTLYREIKERAAREGRTVAAVLEDALRVGMRNAEPNPAEPYVPRTLAMGGLREGIDINSNSSVLDAMDEGLPLEKLR